MQTEMPSTTLHVSLNVSDLDRSIAFYRDVFGLEPAKVRSDYAKFELSDPPLTLALNPGRARDAGGENRRLSHLGIRVTSSAAFAELATRLAGSPVEVFDEGETVCCYAEAKKLWVTDPDGNAWELYQFLADADRRSSEDREYAEAQPAACSDSTGCCG